MKRLSSLLILLLLLALPSLQAQTMSTGESATMRGFGQAVDVADGRVYIGEPANNHQPGAVYVFNRSIDEWAEQARLMAADGRIGDRFGSALSADGNRIVIGAPNGNDYNGAAYIFEQSDDGSWSEVARLVLPDEHSDSGFGGSVVLYEDLAFVGAPDYNEEHGAVFVYNRSESGEWAQSSMIAYPDTTLETGFGSALAFDGSRLAIGAPGGEEEGAVLLFRESMGDWTQETTITNTFMNQPGGFGAVIRMDGDRILVGAPGQVMAMGAVYVYEMDTETEEGTWDFNSRLTAYDSQPRYLFGESIAIAGSEIWIGSSNANGGVGAIYRFQPSVDGSGWTGVTKMTSPAEGNNDSFAGTMDVEGNIAVAGLTGADFGEGTVAIMERSDDGEWSTQNIVIGYGNTILDPITDTTVECSNGQADRFGCSNIDLVSFLPIRDIGGSRGVFLNDMWGWTDPETGNEYALIGRNNGTSFVDVSNPSNPVYVGDLPMTAGAQASTWRDIKVYSNHAFIVADNARSHGMQVFDLTSLRDFNGEPIHFEEAALYTNMNSAHNIVINEDTGMAFIVGSSGGGETCGGGLHMVDIQDPTNPAFAGCFADPSTGRGSTGYTHDAQCVVYQGPDEEHQGKEICIGANETAVSIADVTDKENPVALSVVSYPDYGYVHQGWLTEDHRYFFQNDELDELSGDVEQTRTLIWDVSDLDDPQYAGAHFADNPASDHNLYIKGDMMYQSNYVSGLQVLDISDPVNPQKVGSFDTHPFTEDAPGFSGTWSNYPYFDSGVVLMTSRNEGLFILDVNPPMINP
ncbi:MAG: choice-of-anchor B family protein [Balneolaceae bacterium]